MKTIGIIGAGFTGTMTAVQLIEKSTSPFEIIVINEKETLNKGFAYNPYSDKHLLNVITGKMSAYSTNPDAFLDWVMKKESFKDKDRTLIANSFLPRKLFGEYLLDIWKNATALAASKNITITVVESFVVDLEPHKDAVMLWLANEQKIKVDDCIIASGNLVPRNPRIKNTDFYQSKNYFQNPWTVNSVQNINQNMPVLIVGNGLTMVDTVVSLIEQGFKNDIYSISPNGFNVLPHRHNGLKYTKLTEELKDDMSLFELFKLVKKHIKMAREYGATAEPVIDSLRPYTQSIWKRFTVEEKSIFMSKLRHLWGVARHRLPTHTHDKIQKLRIEGKLHINSGKILNFTEGLEGIIVEYFDKKDHTVKTLKVSRIINCTGPETDLNNVEQSFLKNCLLKGILTQDPLKLGITTNTETYQIINAEGKAHSNLFTLGGNLKGELWESTAVNELRSQAEKLAEQLKVQSNTASIQTANA
ncbi:MAG: hypothetical protein RL427_1853 [Bacteroidota bacterium]|jgi:uncharacterized NAD(P)/FAD-binding protein YdhS